MGSTYRELLLGACGIPRMPSRQLLPLLLLGADDDDELASAGGGSGAG